MNDERNRNYTRRGSAEVVPEVGLDTAALPSAVKECLGAIFPTLPDSVVRDVQDKIYGQYKHDLQIPLSDLAGIVVDALNHSFMLRPDLVQILLSDTETKPPREARDLIRWLIPRKHQRNLIGDLEEEFHEVVKELGPRQATFWYWKEVVVEVAPLVWWTVTRAVRWLLIRAAGVSGLVTLAEWLKSRISGG